MSKGLGKFQKKILKYLQEECLEFNDDKLCIETREFLEKLCGMPDNVKLMDPHYQNQYNKVRKTIRRLDELGWIKNTVLIMNPETQQKMLDKGKKYIPYRHAKACVVIKNEKILNQKTKQTLDLRVQLE